MKIGFYRKKDVFQYYLMFGLIKMKKLKESVTFKHFLIIPGLADEDSDHEEVNKEEELQKETPLPVSKKPFVAKKFRDALRKNDFITGNPRTFNTNS